MKFFSRRRPKNETVRFGLLPALNPADAEWLIKEAAASFGRHGVPVHDAGDGTLRRDDDADGIFGLDNLAIVLREAPRSEWEDMVEQHVAMLTAPQPESPRDVEEFRRLVLPKIVAPEFLPIPVPSYADEFAPGLWQVAALDHPDVVTTLMKGDDLDAVGGWDAVAHAAFANLRALPFPQDDPFLADDDEPASRIHLFEGEDYFVSSRILILDDLMAASGESTVGLPLLVSVPTRSLMMVHIADSLAMIDALNMMAGTGKRMFDKLPGGLSPHVYFREGG